MPNPSCASPVEQRSDLLFRLFGLYVRRYLKRNMHSVRIARPGRAPELGEGPLVVAMNHPGWWDPMIGFPATDLFPDRIHFAPIDEAALEQYSFFRRLGFFAVNQEGLRGARQFIQAADGIFALRNSAVWVTAQGRFSDVRERPVILEPGVGYLARRMSGGGTVLPMAIEYSFWEQSKAEALFRFGAPIRIDDGRARSAAEWTEQITAALTETMDALAADVVARNEEAFDVLIGGSAGVGGIYDLWRRFKAILTGRRFEAEHKVSHALPDR